MINKLISVVTLVGLIAVVLMARADSSDPLFYFLSLDPGATMLKITLVFGMLLMAFKNSFSSSNLRSSMAVFGLSLVTVGTAGLFMPTFGNAIYDFLKPLDFLLLVESGLVYSAAALESPIIKPVYRKAEPAAPAQLTAPATSSAY
ncbi:hypothetical protein H0X09_04035 [Candidatus Saccharibacteria bacterium]|nr:hypothetical protein [Candidatus Saccharibacteria bacterium]